MNEDCTLVNKKYAILDFQFEEECCQQMRWHMEYNQRGESEGTRLQCYVNGTLPVAGRSWMGCKYLLIPSAYPGNECYLFLVNIPEWKFYIYDCSNNVHTLDAIKTHAEATCTVVQTLLQCLPLSTRRDIKKHIDDPMKMEIIPYLPCANNG